MVMAEDVKITKKAGSQTVSVESFETYTTSETSQDVTATNKVIILTPNREVQDEMMKATLEGLAQWEAKHGLNQDE